MTARDLAPGMVLTLRTGRVRILRRADTHGGVELVVCQAGAKVDTSHTRVLWFWGPEAVRTALPEGGGASPGADLPAGGHP